MANNKEKPIFEASQKQKQDEENQRMKDQERIPDDQNRMKTTENQFR